MPGRPAAGSVPLLSHSSEPLSEATQSSYSPSTGGTRNPDTLFHPSAPVDSNSNDCAIGIKLVENEAGITREPSEHHVLNYASLC